MVYIIPNFLGLDFCENFMKIRSKIPKLQTHEKLHKRSFYGGQLKQLYTANFLYGFLIHLKWWSSSSFPNLMVKMLPPPQIQQAPGPDFRKVGKSLNLAGLTD